MKSRKFSAGWLIRLERGEELVVSLIEFAKENKIDSSWIQILGAVSEIELGFYDLEDKSYKWTEFSELMEINNCSGNLLKDESGNLFAHLHGSFSNRNHQTIGGHIRKAITAGTIEILVTNIGLDINRFIDEQTGLKLIDL